MRISSTPLACLPFLISDDRQDDRHKIPIRKQIFYFPRTTDMCNHHKITSKQATCEETHKTHFAFTVDFAEDFKSELHMQM